MTRSGTSWSCSKPLAQMPMMKPSRAKLTQVSRRNDTIQIGCAMAMSTNRNAVSRIITPMNSAFVAAAPT